MTGRKASLIWLLAIAMVAGLFAIAWVVPQWNRLTEQADTLERLERERVTLTSRVEDLTRELNLVLTASSEAEEPQTLTPSATAQSDDAAKRLVEVRLLAETQDRLADAAATITELENRVGELEAAVNVINEENRKLKASEEDLQNQLTSANRVSEAMQVELKSNSDRLVRLEGRNRTLRKKNQEAEEKVTRLAKLSGDLENVHRRQESLLNGIVRRYRDVNDEYRSAALRLNNPEQRDSTPGVDLSRILNAINLAEEDLRQLRTLSSQALRIQRQLSR